MHPRRRREAVPAAVVIQRSLDTLLVAAAAVEVGLAAAACRAVAHAPVVESADSHLVEGLRRLFF